jgi:hypothetical protein
MHKLWRSRWAAIGAALALSSVACVGESGDSQLGPVERADVWISETFSESAIEATCRHSMWQETVDESWFPEIGFSLRDYTTAWLKRCDSFSYGANEPDEPEAEEVAAAEVEADSTESLKSETPTTVPTGCQTVVDGGVAEVKGSLVYRDESGNRSGVPGVRMKAMLDGQVMAETSSCSDGRWSIVVPPGDYEIFLDEESLPREVALRSPDMNPCLVSLNVGETKSALFPLEQN